MKSIPHDYQSYCTEYSRRNNMETMKLEQLIQATSGLSNRKETRLYMKSPLIK